MPPLPQTTMHSSWAHGMRCITSWYQGRYDEADQAAARSVAGYDPIGQEALIRLHGIDIGLTCLSKLAMCSAIQGETDRALEIVEQTITLANKHASPFMLAAVQAYAGAVHLALADIPRMHTHVDELVGLSNQHGILYWLALGNILRGWIWAMQGDVETGIHQIEDNLKAYQATGAVLMQNFFLFLLADAYRVAYRTAEAMETIDQALSMTKKFNVRWWGGRDASAQRAFADATSQRRIRPFSVIMG